MTRILSVTSLLLAVAQLAFAAGPRVDIVIGEKALALEKRAAEDIAFDLKRVYDAEVKIATAAPESAENIIFIGSPETNEQTAKQIAEKWPKLTDQGYVFRTIQYRGKPALFIGGGSPVGVYWAAADYAHSLGVRSLLYGDLYPVAPPPFSLDGFNSIRQPKEQVRSWRTMDPFPTSTSSWGLQEHKQRLRQLSRLRYNRLIIEVRAWQPFAHFEIDGVKKQTGVLGYGWQFPVGGDTAGRAAFKGAKFFENPDFAGATTYDQRQQAGQKLIRGLIDEAHALGMTVGFSLNPLEFPKEFAAVLPASRPEPDLVDLSIRPGREQKLDDEKLLRLAKAQIRAYVETYPQIDAFYFPDAEAAEFVNRLEADPSLFRRKDGQDLDVVGTEDDVASREKRSLNILDILPAAGDAGRILNIVDDVNFAAYQKSRVSFDDGYGTKFDGRDLVPAICGEGVEPSVSKAHDQWFSASIGIASNDGAFSVPFPDMIMKHYRVPEPPPEWWSKVRDNYLGAMNDMYRANSRAREGGRSYTLYLARRCEFGYEYMNCVEATRKAGIAKSKKDTAEQRAQLEKAIESMNAACSALAAVARDQSDRGMIAVCNEFGYKALQKELEKLDGEEGK